MTPEQRAECAAEYAKADAAEGSFMDLIRELPDTTDIDGDADFDHSDQ